MLEQLIESRPARRRSGVQAMFSVVVHGALAIAAVRATTIVAEPRARRVVAPDTTIWIVPERAPGSGAAPRTQSDAGTSRPGDATASLPPAPVFDAPGLPPVSEAAPVEGGGSLLAGLTASGSLSRDSAGDGAAQRVFAELELDTAVEPIDQPAPAYPPALRQAGISGHVDLEYIVGAAGVVEQGSVVIRAAAHPAFAESARAAVLRTRFRPATFRGQPVRQLVRQRVRFDLR